MSSLEFLIPFAFTSIYFRYIFTITYKINYCKVTHTTDKMPQRIVNYFPCVALNINHIGKFYTRLEYLSETRRISYILCTVFPYDTLF
jgi:hypothetical protein